MPDDDRDRPKRSWREIDKMRDGNKVGRGAPLPKASQGELRGGAAKRYRSQLDRIFSGGGLPDEIKRQAPGLGEMEKSESQRQIDALFSARAPADIAKAADALLKSQPMPEDPELLNKILSDPKGKHAKEALGTLLDVLEGGKPSNANLLKSRVQTLKITRDDDADLVHLADCCLAKL